MSDDNAQDETERRDDLADEYIDGTAGLTCDRFALRRTATCSEGQAIAC